MEPSLSNGYFFVQSIQSLRLSFITCKDKDGEIAEATNPENCVVPNANVPTPITAAAAAAAVRQQLLLDLFCVVRNIRHQQYNVI